MCVFPRVHRLRQPMHRIVSMKATRLDIPAWLGPAAPSALRNLLGARYRCASSSGRFTGTNVVGLEPQSKRFFVPCNGPESSPEIAPEPRRERPGNAGKIVSRFFGCKPRVLENGCYGEGLIASKFHDENTVRGQ